MAGARQCPQGESGPLGQRLRRAAQLHYRTESARPRADASNNAPANHSAYNDGADDPAVNRPANVSVNNRAHAFANDPDDDPGTPCADTAAEGHTDHRANVGANVRASHRAYDPGNARPATVRTNYPANASADGRANHPANVRANDPADGRANHPPNVRANDAADVGASHPTNVRANVGASDTSNDIVHTCVDGTGDARTDIARAYPLKRSYSPRFTSDR